MTAVVKRYFQANREDGAGVLKKVRDRLVDLGLYREVAIFEKSGGRSGDLHVETMEYEVYFAGAENGMTRGAVSLYSVVDDSCNGFAQNFSVLIELSDDRDREDRAALIEFLDVLDFVTKYRSFKERPFGCKRFRGHLDDAPAFPDLRSFAHEEHASARRQAA